MLLKRLFLFFAASAVLLAQNARITEPVVGNPSVSGWSVEPGHGSLRFSVPVGRVPGELPIPVALTMNGTFMRYGTYHPPRIRTNTGTTSYIDYGIYGTLGFGYIGYSSGPGNYIVLEDGRTYSVADFASYSSSSSYSSYGTSLLNAFGVTGTPSQLQINSDATLAWAWVPNSSFTSSFASFANVVLANLPTGFPVSTTSSGDVISRTNFDLLADKDCLRVYAEVGTGNAMISIPVYWVDRYGHYVIFKWSMNTGGLPAGVTAIGRVDAVNQRGKGVTVRWANWSDTTSTHDLLRADFVNCEGPSILVRGFSGAAKTLPVGVGSLADNEGDTETSGTISLGGMVARPQSITIGDPNSLSEPSWNACNAAAAPPAFSSVNSGSASQTWNLIYDANGAALSSLTDPRGVSTAFSYQDYAVYGGVSPWAPMELFGVTKAAQADASGKSSYTHTTTWNRTLPVESTAMAFTQPNWVVTCQDWWNNGDSASPDRTTTYTYASPSSSGTDFLNGFLSSVVVTDGSGNVLSSTTMTTMTNNSLSTKNGGGLDGSLSIPQTITTTRANETSRKQLYTYTDSSYLQVQSVTNQVWISGAFQTSQVQSFRYDPLWSRLVGQEVNQIQTTRYNPSTGAVLSPGTLTTTNVWDQSSLQLLESYLDAGASYQHGTQFSYYPSSSPNSGKIYAKGIWHRENSATTATSPGTTTYSYDATTGEPSGTSTSYQDVNGSTGTISASNSSFDGGDRPQVVTDAQGASTNLIYDLYGRTLTSQRQGTAQVRTSYVDPWTASTTQDARGTTSHYDGFGRLIRQDQWDGTALAYAYDLHGRLASTTRLGTSGGRVTASTTYDLLDRPIAQTGYTGVTVGLAYAAGPNGGNQVTRGFGANAATNPTVTLTDAFGQVVQSTAPSGDVSITTYDGWGSVLQVQTTSAATGAVQTRTFTHSDPLGRLTSKAEPETGAQTFQAFNALNQPTYVVEAGTRARTLGFDGLGRLRSVTSTLGGTTATETFTYAGSVLTDASNALSGNLAYTVSQHYDYYSATQGGFLQDETTTQAGNTSRIAYTYTDLGSVQSVAYPSGRVVTYGVDGLGRAVNVTSVSGGAYQTIIPTPSVSPFDQWGNRTSLIFQSGAQDQWSPDATQARLGSWTVTPKGGSPMGWSYSYQPTTGWMTGTDEWSFTPNSLNQLTSVTQNWAMAMSGGSLTQTNQATLSDSLTHDAFGNNSASTFTSAAALPGTVNSYAMSVPATTNQLPSTTNPSGYTGVVYDPWGEMTQLDTLVSSSSYLGFGWDPLGRLASTSASSTGSVESYQYAPSGIRVSRFDNLNSALNRYYAYSSGGTLMEELPSSGISRDVIYLDGRAIAEIDGSGLHELHSDHLGTPRIVTNAATGAVEGVQTYGPYGETLSASGYVPLTGYTGHIQTEPNGLIYMRGRFFSPAWHRFLNSDQGADPNQANQVAYCLGNPMVATDPAGLSSAPGDESPWQMYQRSMARIDGILGDNNFFGESADLWQHTLPGVTGSVTIYTGDSPYLNNFANYSLMGQTDINKLTINGQSAFAIWEPGGKWAESVIGGQPGVPWEVVLMLSKLSEGWDFYAPNLSQTNQDSGWRLPDVLTLNLGIVVGVGAGVNVSWDWRHNRGYLGLSGAGGVGGKYSAGLTGSWVLGSNGPASAEAINGIYTGFGTSESGGFIGGIGSTQSDWGGSGHGALTFDAGLMLPGAGGTAGWGWQIWGAH